MDASIGMRSNHLGLAFTIKDEVGIVLHKDKVPYMPRPIVGVCVCARVCG